MISQSLKSNVRAGLSEEDKKVLREKKDRKEKVLKYRRNRNA